MLSKTISRSLAARGALFRSSMRMQKVIKPGNHVCFCGCHDGKHFGNPTPSIVSMPSRNFQGHLGLDSVNDLVP